MKPPEFLDIDPRKLRLPTTRLQGANPGKLQRQIARHGRSLKGMPPLECYLGSDGEIVINNGVTRATRAAKLCPGSLIPIEIAGTLKYPVGHHPTVEDKLP